VNRSLGAALGGLKAVLVWFAVLSIATAFDLDAWRLWGTRTAGDVARSSYAVRIAGVYNPLESLAIASRIGAVRRRLSTPEGRAELADSPAFKRLWNSPGVRAVLDDPALKEAMDQRRVIDVMSNPKVQELTRDPETMALMRDFLLEVARPEGGEAPDEDGSE
jgi:hypothetical protein